MSSSHQLGWQRCSEGAADGLRRENAGVGLKKWNMNIMQLGIQAVTKAMEAKNWELAVQLRGKSFQRNLETYRMLTRCQ